MSPRIAVVGAGAVGVTTARELAERGAEVVVFERDAVAAGSSGRAAGVCYDAYAGTLDAELADRAMDRFREFDRAGLIRFTDCPYVITVQEGDAARADALPAVVDRMRSRGRDVAVVDPAALGERFPLRTDDVAVAAVAENAGYVDPGAYTRAIADDARGHGVEFRTGSAVGLDPDGPAIERRGSREGFDAVVVAAGAATGPLLADAGVPVAVAAYRVQAAVGLSAYDGPMTYDATAGTYLRPHPEGVFVGDGTEPVAVDPDDWDGEADEPFIEAAAAFLRRRIDAGFAAERAWAGLCTATPDGDPLVGERAPGVHVAVGWHGHGFMRAPAIGERLAEAVLGGPAIDAFDPNRFDPDAEFEIVEGMLLEER